MKTKPVQQKKPRVLFLYDFPFRGGGSGVYIKYLALRLQEAYGYDLAIAAPDKKTPDPAIKNYFLRLPQIPVYISRPGLERQKKYSELTNREIAGLYYAYIRETIKVIEDFKPDIIHVHHILINAWAARFIRSLYGTKIIATSHGSCIHAISKDRRYFRMTRDALWAASAITVVSGDTRAKFLSMFGTEFSAKTRTIPGGVRMSLFPERISAKEKEEVIKKYKLPNKKLVLFTGRLISEKGVEYLVNAATKIQGTIVIAGDGPARAKLEEVVRKKSLTNVHILGYIDHSLLIHLYYIADVFVSPSVWDDPMPITILEAMASGLPVVVTRRGGIPIAVKDRINGLFVRSRNATDIVEKVNMLLNNDTLRKKLGQRARETVKERFTWRKIAARFDKLYRDTYIGR